MSSKVMLIHCLSPLHAGVGQGVDVVDLAIARDRATGFPYLPGSSIKGSLRDVSQRRDGGQGGRDTVRVFGPDTAQASDHAGSVAFGDGNLVCLPTRSVKGTFAYVTSPYLLARLSRDLEQAGLPTEKIPHLNKVDDAATTGDTLVIQSKVYFEDLDLNDDANHVRLTQAWADLLGDLLFADKPDQQKLFKDRFVVVHDDVMAFLSKHGTDVVTRVSIEAESKTAKAGQLWTEENLPSESILASLVQFIPIGARNDISAAQAFGVLDELSRHEVQFGGKATVGRGRCKIQLKGGAR